MLTAVKHAGGPSELNAEILGSRRKDGAV